MTLLAKKFHTKDCSGVRTPDPRVSAQRVRPLGHGDLSGGLGEKKSYFSQKSARTNVDTVVHYPFCPRRTRWLFDLTEEN